jgi:hypothetical protein
MLLSVSARKRAGPHLDVRQHCYILNHAASQDEKLLWIDRLTCGLLFTFHYSTFVPWL